MITPNPFEVIDSRLSKIESLLIDIKHRPAEVSDSGDGDLMTVPQAANYLSLSVATIYGMISRGELPVMKRSKRCYFSKADLIEYLKQGRKGTVNESVNDAMVYMASRKKSGGVK